MAVEEVAPRRWHQALAYALLGRRLDTLGAQTTPEVRALAQQLQYEVEVDLVAEVRVQTGEVWPHPVPADLMAGLGPAQFASALQLLQRELGLDLAGPIARVGREQRETATDRRLLEDVPPHHG